MWIETKCVKNPTLVNVKRINVIRNGENVFIRRKDGSEGWGFLLLFYFGGNSEDQNSWISSYFETQEERDSEYRRFKEVMEGEGNSVD